MSVQKFPTLKVEISGIFRTGTASKTGRPYCMYEGYVHLPNVPYPQSAQFYCEVPTQVPAVGVYDCDVMPQVRDGRLHFDCDPRQGRKLDLPPMSAASPSPESRNYDFFGL